MRARDDGEIGDTSTLRFAASRDPLAERPDDELMRRARRAVLVAGTELGSDPLSLDLPRWTALASWAHEQSLMPLLGLAVAPLDDVPATVTRRIDHAARREWIARRGLVRLAHDVADELAAADIDVRFLKGVVTSATVYADPHDRAFNDVDIVVRPSDWERAVARLGSSFDVRSNDTMFGDTGELLHPSLALVSRAYGLEVDLHRRVQGRSLAHRIPENVVMGPPAMVDLDGRSIPAMRWECQVLHTCLHLSSHLTRLSTAADLLRQLVNPRTDPSVLSDFARDVGLLAPLQWAVSRLATFVPLDDLASAHVVLDAPCRRIDVRRWELTLGGTAGRMLVDLQALGPRRAARLASEVVWPAPGFLADRRRTRLEHLRYIATPSNQRRRP